LPAYIYKEIFATPESSPNPSNTPPSPVSFDYNFGVYPNNGSVQQGNSLQTNANITYLQGSTQAVTLNASAEPNNIICRFSSQAGIPSNNSTFTSTLTINALATTPAGIYPVNITATTANGKAYSSVYTLTVFNTEIQVSGTLVCNSSNDTYPTEIQFAASTPTYTASTFNVGVHYNFGLPLQRQGTYSISLPNQQNYIVIITWKSLTGIGTIPNPADMPSGTIVYGSLLVNCTIGVTSMTQDFSF
jgi:hypothetical protein